MMTIMIHNNIGHMDEYRSLFLYVTDIHSVNRLGDNRKMSEILNVILNADDDHMLF